MQSQVKSAILKRIRSQGEDSTSAAIVNVPQEVASAVTIREAQFADFERVNALNRGLGQGTDSLENWLRLWRDNPALKSGRAPRIGWVLESGSQVVGFLGSIPLDYSFDGRNLAAAATCRFAVLPEFRGLSHLLVTSFFRQKDVELFLNSTATPAAAKIMLALKATPLPQPDFGTVLFWVVRPSGFVKNLAGKAKLNPLAEWLAVGVGSALLATEKFAKRRLPRINRHDFTIKEFSFDELGEEFDRFWTRRESEPGFLHARRSREIMRWHFLPPNSRRDSDVLACYSGRELLGYAIVRHDPPLENGYRRSLLADLQILPTAADALLPLTAVAYRTAHKRGSHVLEVIGFPKEIRNELLLARPYSRQYPAEPFYFKVRDKGLQETLSDPNVWYATPYDGDSTLWP